jgi:hypothetical protein
MSIRPLEAGPVVTCDVPPIAGKTGQPSLALLSCDISEFDTDNVVLGASDTSECPARLASEAR